MAEIRFCSSLHCVPNPNSGFFGSNIARKNFLKYVIDCSKDIINNYGL